MRSNAGSKFRMQRGCAIVLCKQTWNNLPEKQKILSLQSLAGTGSKFLRCHPAWYVKHTPSYAYHHTQTFVYGEPHSVSHTREILFCSPSEVHSALSFRRDPTIHDSLWEKLPKAYSLFLNGLVHCSTHFFGCQLGFWKNFDFCKKDKFC